MLRSPYSPRSFTICAPQGSVGCTVLRARRFRRKWLFFLGLLDRASNLWGNRHVTGFITLDEGFGGRILLGSAVYSIRCHPGAPEADEDYATSPHFREQDEAQHPIEDMVY